MPAQARTAKRNATINTISCIISNALGWLPQLADFSYFSLRALARFFAAEARDNSINIDPAQIRTRALRLTGRWCTTVVLSILLLTLLVKADQVQPRDVFVVLPRRIAVNRTNSRSGFNLKRRTETKMLDNYFFEVRIAVHISKARARFFVSRMGFSRCQDGGFCARAFIIEAVAPRHNSASETCTATINCTYCRLYTTERCKLTLRFHG